MIYITPTEVRGVIKTTLTDENIEEFISTAHLLVTRFLASRGVVDDLQSEIKKYIAAHLIGASLKDRSTGASVLEEKIGDVEVKYGDVVSSNKSTGHLSDLRTTRWGQTAILLDPSGVLGKLGLPPPRMVAL